MTHRTIETNAAGEMTKRGQKAWRGSLEAHGTAKIRAEARAGVQAAREALRAAREHRRDRMKVAVAWCQEARAANREKIRATRAAAMLLLREEANLVRANARAECSAAKDAIRGSAEPDLVKARLILGEERKYQAQISRSHKPSKLGAAKRATARELEQESDDAVRRNLEAGSAHLIPVFDRVKGAIRASDRISRTEAFLQWAEENPSEVLSISGEDVDRDVAEAVRAHQRAELEERRARKLRTPLGPKARELARLAEGSAYRLIPSKNRGRGRGRGKASARTLALPTRAEPAILSARELADNALNAIELERSRETPLEAEARGLRGQAREAAQLEAARVADAKFEADRAAMAEAWAAKDAAKEARGQLKDSLLTRLEKAFDLAVASWELAPEDPARSFKVDEIGRALGEANKGRLTPRARDRLDAAHREIAAARAEKRGPSAAQYAAYLEADLSGPPRSTLEAEASGNHRLKMEILEAQRAELPEHRAARLEHKRATRAEWIAANEPSPLAPPPSLHPDPGLARYTPEQWDEMDRLEAEDMGRKLREGARREHAAYTRGQASPANEVKPPSRWINKQNAEEGAATLMRYAKEWAKSSGTLPLFEAVKMVGEEHRARPYGVGNVRAHFKSTRAPLAFFTTRASAKSAAAAASRAAHRALLSPAPF